MFPSNLYFENYNKNSCDGQILLTQFKPALILIARYFIGSRYILRQLEARGKKKTLVRQKVSSARNNEIYNLRKNYSILNDGVSKRSLSPRLHSHNLRPRVPGFMHAYRYIFFSADSFIILFSFKWSNLAEAKLLCLFIVQPSLFQSKTPSCLFPSPID